LFLTNLRVRGWMDHQTLSQFRKDLIMVTLMGDRHGRPAVDYTVNPSLGFPAITGAEGSTDPVAHALPAWDCIAGNLVVSSLLAAERHRLKTGDGQDVELALKDVATAMLGHLGILSDVELNGTEREKSGNSLYGAYGQDFVCKDGRRIMVIGLTARQWSGLVKITETGEAMAALEAATGKSLRDEGVRWELRDAITAILQPWFAARSVGDFAETFENAGLTWSEFRTFSEAMEQDADLSTDNPMFARINQPGLGETLVPGSPVTFSKAPRIDPEPAPALGTDTEEILGDVVGMDNREISDLFDKGIVQSPQFSNARSAA
jgi:2-methylfumaryl-CoA isomerase